jgi:acylglycerol lipase
MIPTLVVNAYRYGLMVLIVFALTGCSGPFRLPVASGAHPIVTDGYFTLHDGARLPYRDWLPQSRPRAVVLALHGFNDSRDAWAGIAPLMTARGIALFAQDQRGFGLAPQRGYWPGGNRLVDDARQMAATLHARYPGVPLTVMGGSMGGAVALVLGAQGDAAVSSYVLIAPAVWGGKAMAWRLRASLTVADTFVPGLRLTGRQAAVRASDNTPALIAFSNDPLTIHATRIATLAGLTRLMARAQADCARFAPANALILYGGHDQLIPKTAMAACWHALPRGRIAYYPHDYHLMLLDHERATPSRDIIGFILHPRRPLHSDAATNAMIFSAQH